MFYRIKRNASSIESGGADPASAGNTPPPAPAPATPPPTAVESPASGNPEVVTLPASEFHKLLTRMNQLDVALAQVENDKKADMNERIRLSAESGRHKEAYEQLEAQSRAERTQLEERLASLNTTYRNTIKETAIQSAIASRSDLVPGAAVHIANLLRSDPNLEVAESNGTYTVRTKDFRSTADRLSDLLKDPSNQMFLKPTSSGGTGAPAQVRGGQATEPEAPKVPTLIEQLAGLTAVRGLRMSIPGLGDARPMN